MANVLLLGILAIYLWTFVGSEDVCTKDSCGEPVFIGNFHIPTTPLPRLPVTDAQAQERLKNGLPVVLTDTAIFSTDTAWSLDYLERALSGSEEDWKVFQNEKDRRFLYHKEDTNYANYKWTPPYSSGRMKFLEFVELFRKIESEGSTKKIYFQSGFYQRFLDKAVYRFNETALEIIAGLRKSLGPEGNPWFYIGMKDVLTPMHFDYSENIVIQIYGHKRVILVGPEHYRNLYPYPRFHPHDRQSRIDMENPDYNRFPRFKDVTGYETILKPGDMLFLPTTWWHLVESEHHSETVSLSISMIAAEAKFRHLFSSESAAPFETRRDGSVTYISKKDLTIKHNHLMKAFNMKAGEPVYFPRPDSPARQVHVRRMVEQLIAESTGNYRDVGRVLREMYESRFDHLEFAKKKKVPTATLR